MSSPQPPLRVPTVLYACVHNAGRSVAAKVLTEHYAAGRVAVLSAGSEPADAVNPVVAEVLARRGLSTQAERPRHLSGEVVGQADVVVTMGCGETCPFVPGRRYEDWVLEDPAGQSVEVVERIVSAIDARVRALLSELGVDL